MRTTDLHWVAGFLEGEGCFGVTHVNKNRYTYLTIQVTSVDKDVLERLASATGVGRIDGPHKTRSKLHNPTYAWRCQKQAEAEPLMRKLYPMLGERRRKQIETAFEAADKVL